jgi:hypothetical protein
MTPQNVRRKRIITTFYSGGAYHGTESHWYYQTADQRR